MILIGRTDEDELLNLIGERKGSIVAYFGYVRGESGGKKVKGMICEEKKESHEIMEKIEEEIKKKYPVERIILYHSVGRLNVGDMVSAVIVSTVHRKEGFEACKMGIDLIKKLEPVKREEIQE